MVTGGKARGPGWLAAIALAAACAAPQGGWDYSDLPAGLGDRTEVRNSRLFDSAPHWVPSDRGLLLFLCRWPDLAPIPVSLPPDADSRELRILRVALAAWSNAGLGIRFQEVVPDAARLEILFTPSGDASPRGSGDALADCAIDIGPNGVVFKKGQVQARIVWASIHLNRRQADALGREMALDDDQLLGAALHELGHALGYSGHPVQGASIMQRTTDEVRKIGARVASGAPFIDPNLRALYALPTGVVVGRIPLGPDSARLIARFDANARKVDFDGPFSRVGDTRTRYFYRGDQGTAYALTATHWRPGGAQKAEIVFQANAAAQVLLRLAGPTKTPAP